ncbi:DNA-binding response regulator [Rhodococcus rhodnii]|uniref:Response regulator n=2 Tax=Rhodococcus rhodnii TaxID=38312 RepID=R7WS91_9NOCA|nr:response regulator transcription factor [Rhodococcus rhodnii]EOM78193.1 response regulator [Rhodococcus rhodnii LMG 5362]TXG90954.1 DNA-binding response regulator [Rhodococcus rhodnii]
MTGQIRILLADDDAMIRDALTGLLERSDDLVVVATAGNGHDAIDAALAHRPDVAVVDLQMPSLDGLGVIAELARVLPSCAGVILTGHGRPHVLRPALESGARGFLAKGAPSSALAEVVRRVHAGERYVDPVLAAEALTAPETPLTPRETDVLRAAARTTSIREIARTLGLSQGTVRNHLGTAARKLEADGRSDAVRVARENGWL